MYQISSNEKNMRLWIKKVLDELEELRFHVSNLIPFIWFPCEGYFKGSQVIKYLCLACLKVVLWFVVVVYGSFVSTIYWTQVYSDTCQTSEMHLFAKPVNNWKLLSLISKNSILDIDRVLKPQLNKKETAGNSFTVYCNLK